MKLFQRKAKLPTTQEGMDAFVDALLVQLGFEVSDELRALAGSFIQHSDETKDTISPALLGRCIRKAMANQCAFYLIHPQRRPKPEAAPLVEPSNEQV